MRRMAIKRTAGGNDYAIILATFLLVIFGLVMLASASSHLGQRQFNDGLYYLKHQLLYGFLVGAIGFFLASKIHYRFYEKIAFPLLLLALLLLLLTFTRFGVAIGGASRWLNLGPITFQPSELLKAVFIIYLAAWLGRGEERRRDLARGFLPFVIILGLTLFLLFKQPATSTAIILAAVALIMYFLSGARLSYILAVIMLILITLSIVIYYTPYRLERITAFLNPEADPQASGYQVNQAKIAIGSGQLWGVGYGQSISKINILPEPIHDSIFAVVAEELGFVGASALLALLLILIIRILVIAKRTRDQFGQLLLVGFASLIALQSFVNIGAISGLLPLTGTPLPFISFGGTALAVFMTVAGIANNVAKYS